MMKKTAKTWIAVVCLIALLAGLAGCATTGTGATAGGAAGSGAAGSSTAAGGSAGTTANGTGSASGAAATGTSHILANGRYDKLVVAAAIDPQDLEPDSVNEDPRFYFIYDIYETLFDQADDGSGNLVPCMAEGYEVVNPTTWKVTLRKDIKDWDGNAITTDDVIYSFKYLIDSGSAIRFDFFDSIEKIDDYTFNMHWTSEPPSMHDLEFPLSRAIVFSQKSYEAKGGFAKTPVGTGCYKVTEFASGSKLVLEANDSYWGIPYLDKMEKRHTANVQTLEFDVIPEASTAVVGLETGKLDVCGYVPLSMQEEFSTGSLADQYNVDTIVQGDYWYVAPNCENLTDANLRTAIFYAIDNAAVAKAMGGSFVPMTTYGTSAYRDYDATLEQSGNFVSDYSIEKAKEYLAKSGYKGEKLMIVTNNSEAAKTAVQMIQTLLLQVGIQTEINATTRDSYTNIVTHGSGEKWDLFVNTVGGPSIVGSWHFLFDNEVQNGVTTSFVNDPKLQELYEAASADATHDAAHMKALIDYVVQNAYVYPLVGQSSALVYPSSIEKMYYREGYYYPSASTFAK